MDRIDKIINATKFLRESVPTIIDVFTMFYGEENREYITKKFTNAMIICYHKNDELYEIVDDIFQKMKREKAEELIRETFLEYNLPVDEKFVETSSLQEFEDRIISYPLVEVRQYMDGVILRDRYNELLKYVPDLKVYAFSMGIFTDKEVELIPKDLLEDTIKLLKTCGDYPDIKLGGKKHAVSIISLVLDGVNEDNIDDMIRDGKLDLLSQLSKTLVKKREEDFEKFCSSQTKIDDIISYLDKEEIIRKRIEYKYYLTFINLFRENLNSKDQSVLSRIDTSSLDSISDDELDFCITPGFLPDGLEYSFFLKYFYKKYDDKLVDPNTPGYVKDTIKRERIRYFNYYGIRHGQKYEDYLDDPLVKEKWPEDDFIKKIEDAFNHYKQEYEKELFNYQLNSPIFEEFSKEAERLGLLDKEALFSPENVLQNEALASVELNYVKTGDGYKLFPQIIVGMLKPRSLDQSVIHEFNHVYESFMLDCDDEDYSAICGWDGIGLVTLSMITEEKADKKSETVLDDYKAFSEIINEKISQRITMMMHEKGIYLFSEPEDAIVVGASGYENTAFLVEDFFDEYFDAIIKSRRDGNIALIWDKVGRENFDELNQLFHEFRKLFSGSDSLYLKMDLEKGEKTPLTDKYDMLREKRDRVLENMREYSKNHSAKLD